MPCILMHRPALTPDSPRACLMRRLTPRRESQPGCGGRRKRGGGGQGGSGGGPQRQTVGAFLRLSYHRILHTSADLNPSNEWIKPW